jgi:pyruvate,water dikinase
MTLDFHTMHSRAPATDVGGKAKGLYDLVELGLAVPTFIVLPAELQPHCPDQQLDPAQLRVIHDAWEYLGSGQTPVAVRSSAVGEDGTSHSYAGQLETRLNVQCYDDFVAGIRDCWRSAHSERLASYRRARGEPETPMSVAVVCQHMVNAQTSGVLFTTHPLSGNDDQMVISSVYGLGEGLVSGALDADQFVTDRMGTVLEEDIVIKDSAYDSITGSSGTWLREIPTNAQAEASLRPELLAQIARGADRAHRKAGLPLDIEFAIEDDQPWFLQARPVTAVAPATGDEHVWDNSNINESYPGRTLPLTFSFIRRAYHAVYWQFCEVLGLGPEEIEQHNPMLQNMLGHIEGQVYYNIHNWYRLVSLLPGFHFNREFMETMMGMDPAHRLDEPNAFRKKSLREFTALIRSGLRAIGLHRQLPQLVGQFHQDFEKAYAHFARLDYESMPPQQIIEHYLAMEKEVLWKWKAPIINDFDVMIFYGLLTKLTAAWDVDAEGSLHNGLLGQQGGIESTLVADELLHIADGIRADTSFAKAFIDAAPAEALTRLREHPLHGPSWARYLESYGDRCVEELKWESPTTADDPSLVIARLQAFVHNAPRRRTATPQATDMMNAVNERLRGWRRTLYLWVLKNAKAGIKNRENQRLARTRAFGIARRMFRAVGGRWAERGYLKESADIHYLTLDEILEAGDGTVPDGAALQGLVHRRKIQHLHWGSQPLLSDRLTTCGDAIEQTLATPSSSDSATELFGQSAFPGVVRAPCVVLSEPQADSDIDGKILVTRQTDPGWVVLFPSISGLVVERGSMLSHSAIVAREMGIPCVVGVRHATRKLRSGEEILLDATQGRVERHDD